ncbi:2-phospho-L-lactate guanylyltransferase [Frankia gtarii]|uniref:2-phospho-L-lactate guanylyltransferase n=1 Tax=Frankia gtarii TaxID=2950102 RepID=UPI0021BE828B|nr:2-phospho-L-lactate guanylyltransferase [Frankia gtarii]
MVTFVWLPQGGASWTVLLPLKNLARAKSRLDRPDRSLLALAMAIDTVTAVLASATDLVGAVVIVTNDQTFRRTLSRLRDQDDLSAGDGADPSPAPALSTQMRARLVVVADTPDQGLNPALAHGAELAAGRWPGHPLAALSGDLPALRTAELHRALAAAGNHRRAVLADAAGTGTVLLTATTGAPLGPAFGPHSRVAHRRSGAVDLTDALGSSVPGLRRDVDTVDDLAQARDLGVGRATAAALLVGQPAVP